MMGDEADRIIEDGELNELLGEEWDEDLPDSYLDERGGG